MPLVTSTVIVQLPLAGIEAPDWSVIVPLPGVATSVPVQVVAALAGVATTTLAGSVSTRSAFSTAAVGWLLLRRVIVSVLVPPVATWPGAKLFCTLGAPGPASGITARVNMARYSAWLLPIGVHGSVPARRWPPLRGVVGLWSAAR
ncbi:MAG: hypothetical protein BWX64_01271 [Acidobacteria bacterium ADurb.Bin051]|nr:MAG: hypothetical protein BWX64_01271 [Acidobacteria bacterium ADurb.Bin051]